MISGALAGIGGAIYAQSISVNFMGDYYCWSGSLPSGHDFLGNGTQSVPCWLVSSLELRKVWLLSGIKFGCYRDLSNCLLDYGCLASQAVASKADGKLRS